MKEKYVDRKEEMGKLIEEEYEVEGKDIKEDTTGFSMGKKALKQATEKAIDKKTINRRCGDRYGQERS